MVNPFESPQSASSIEDARVSLDRHRFAGWWLITAGLLHLLASNLLSNTDSFATVIWEPACLAMVGVLVLYRVRIAVAFTRLIGSFIGLGLIAALIILIFRGDAVASLTYGRFFLEKLSLWQQGLFLLVMAATFMPPWWSLQMAIRDGNKKQIPEK